MIYLDTSTLAPLYWPEPISARVQREIAKAGPPAITQLGEVELVSAIARRLRTRDLTVDEAARIVAQFTAHLTEGAFARLVIDSAHFARARNFISQFNNSLRTLDALHLAVAQANKLQLATADKALSDAAGKFGVTATLLSP